MTPLLKPLFALTALIAATLAFAGAVSMGGADRPADVKPGSEAIHLVPPLAPAEAPHPLPRVTEA